MVADADAAADPRGHFWARKRDTGQAEDQRDHGGALPARPDRGDQRLQLVSEQARAFEASEAQAGGSVSTR